MARRPPKRERQFAMARILIGIVTYLLLTLTTVVAQQSAVDGIVVKLGTGEALAEAQVELTKTDGPSYRASSGADGQLVFQTLEPAEHRLSSTQPAGVL